MGVSCVLVVVGLLALIPYFAETKQITRFDGFCDEAKLYKPYIKYYRGKVERNGPSSKTFVPSSPSRKPMKTHKPGFYTDFLNPKMKNTQICINGMAWLYYKITTRGVTVYEAPELHAYIHQCMLVNELKGPGGTVNPKMLYGILLMGDPVDYRKPSIQLFTAPTDDIRYPDGTIPPKHVPVPPRVPGSPNPIIHGTSLFMIGDETECILTKGNKKTQIRIRSGIVKEITPPTDGYQGSFCKLSYTHLHENIGKPAIYDLPEDDIKILNWGLRILAGNLTIKAKGCYVPDNYTHITDQIISDRIKQIQEIKTKMALIPKDNIFDNVGYFDIPGRLKKGQQIPGYSSKYDDFYPYTITDDICTTEKFQFKCSTHDRLPPCTLPTPPECASPACDPCSLEKILEFVSWTNGEINEENKKDKPEATFIDAAKVDILKARVRPLQQNANKRHKELVELYEAIGVMWGTTIKTKMKEITKAREDKDLVKAKEASKELAPLVSKGESMRLQLDLYLEQTKKAFEDLISKMKVAVGGENPGVGAVPSADKSDTIFIKRTGPAEYIKLPTIPAITDPPTPIPDITKFPSEPEKTCGLIPQSKKACRDSKPDMVRACELLQARKGNFPNPIDGEEWRTKVLKYLEDIYFSATSPILKREFATQTRRMGNMYLSQSTQGHNRGRRSTNEYNPNHFSRYKRQNHAKNPLLKNKPKDKGRSISMLVTSTTTPRPNVTTTAPKSATGVVPPGVATTPVPPTASVVPGQPTVSPRVSPTAPINETPTLSPVLKTTTIDPRCFISSTTIKPPTNKTTAKQRQRRFISEDETQIETPKKKRSPPIKKTTIDKTTTKSNEGKAVNSKQPPPICPPILPSPTKKQEWEEIMKALESCKKKGIKLDLRRRMNNNKIEYYTTTTHKRNKTSIDMRVVQTLEQADQEHTFNYVIDSLWKIFVTVLGICMPSQESKYNSIASKFYSYFSQDFLIPLSNQWINPDDNTILEVLMGGFYGKQADIWTNVVMDAVFSGGNEKYRPIRPLLVNGGSEKNFFVSGPLAGTTGMY